MADLSFIEDSVAFPEKEEDEEEEEEGVEWGYEEGNRPHVQVQGVRGDAGVPALSTWGAVASPRPGGVSWPKVRRGESARSLGSTWERAGQCVAPAHIWLAAAARSDFTVA